MMPKLDCSIGVRVHRWNLRQSKHYDIVSITESGQHALVSYMLCDSAGLFFRALSRTVPESQLNFLSCQIKVNLRKPLWARSERVCSGPDSCLLIMGREGELEGAL